MGTHVATTGTDLTRNKPVINYRRLFEHVRLAVILRGEVDARARPVLGPGGIPDWVLPLRWVPSE
jgi:hypothetical protein